MSVCSLSNTSHDKKLDKNNYIEAYINTKVDKERSIPFGFTSSVDKSGNSNMYMHGFQDLEQGIPFKEDSIYRMASQSKFMGTTAFLKLIDKGLVDWSAPLSKYLPEYSSDHIKVINPYISHKKIRVLSDGIYTTVDSNIIYIRKSFNDNSDDDLREGDYISLEWANGNLNNAEFKLPEINGIPGFELFNIHKIVKADKKGYNIVLHTKANTTGYCGKYIKIIKVEKGVLRSICFSPDKMFINPKISTYYYTLQPLKRELTILDVLTHGIGWVYYSSALLYACFGYQSDSIKSNIQAGIWNELGIPVGVPRNYYKCGIREWVRLASNVPLLYQPGEDWSYGPQLSILGALIEIIDGRSVNEYMKEELWKPLGMNNTGFFDPNEEKLCKLYVNMPRIVLKFMGDDILEQFPPVFEANNCLTEGPRTLCLIDCGMYTTVNDYLKFLKMFLTKNNGILSDEMIKIISTYETCYDVSNLSSISSYISSGQDEIKREKLLKDIKWGLGVGVMKGCKAIPGNKDNENELAITWGGVLGTRFLIDFCAGVAYNVGTNVIGPPAGTFDSDLIELNYKPMNKSDYDLILAELVL